MRKIKNVKQTAMNKASEKACKIWDEWGERLKEQPDDIMMTEEDVKLDIALMTIPDADPFDLLVLVYLFNTVDNLSRLIEDELREDSGPDEVPDDNSDEFNGLGDMAYC